MRNHPGEIRNLAHGNTQYIACLDCGWYYEPTKYEQDHADPIGDLLSYYRWMHMLEELAKKTRAIVTPTTN